jgi:hypothetical protein
MSSSFKFALKTPRLPFLEILTGICTNLLFILTVTVIS